MIDERTEELAAAHALGLLEGAEARDFGSRLKTDSALAQIVAEHQDDAAALAYAVPPLAPTAELKSRVLQALQADEAKIVPFPLWKIALPWAIAASLAIMAGVLYQDRAGLRQEVAALEARDNLAQVKVATLTALVDNYTKGTAVVLWEPERQTGVIRVSNMPAVRADQDYQLWIIDPAYQAPVSGGVFHPEAGLARTSFKPVQPITHADKFAISLERKGGVPQSAGPVLMLGE